MCDRFNTHTCDLLTPTEMSHLNKKIGMRSYGGSPLKIGMRSYGGNPLKIGMRSYGGSPLKIKSCLSVPAEGQNFIPRQCM